MGVGEVQGGVIDGSNLKTKSGARRYSNSDRKEVGGGLLTEQLVSDKYKPIY